MLPQRVLQNPIISNDEPQERAPDPTSAAERLSLAAHQKRQAKLGFVPGIDFKGPVDTADNVRAAREQLGWYVRAVASATGCETEGAVLLV